MENSSLETLVSIAFRGIDIYPCGVYSMRMKLRDNQCKSCNGGVKHPDHSKQLHRINRAIGQLEGVKRMIEQQRYCPDILTQTRAASSAIRSLESNILHTHLRSCVKSAFESDKKEAAKKVDELVEIFKKYK